MNCPIRSQQHREWLLEYSAGRLDPVHTALVERHVEICQDCARFVEAQVVVWNALGRWEPEQVSPDFNRRLYHRIEQARSATWLNRVFRPLHPLWRPALPLAATCLLIVLGVALHLPRAVMNPGASPSRVESIEPEQVERTLDDMQMLRELALTPQQERDTSRPM